MRHRVLSKRLKRASSEYQSFLKNMASEVITHGSIVTTLAKAKVSKPFIEKLITKAKVKDFASVKLVKARMSNSKAVRELFDVVAPKYMKRNGGYLRIVKLNTRLGDNSLMARLELVEEKK